MRKAEHSASASTFRNLIFNPQFAGVTVSAVVRTNLAPNPNSVLATGWFTASGVASTAATNQTTSGLNGRAYSRITCTATATGTGYFAVAYGQIGAGANAAQVTAGTTYTLSLYVRATLAGAFQQPKVRLRWKDASGATLPSDIVIVASGATSGNWVRLSASGVAPTNASYIEAMGGYDNSLNLAGIAVGDTVDVTCVLVEASVNLDYYFEGQSGPNGDYTHSWSGTTNASISRQLVLTANNLIVSKNGSNVDAKFYAYQSVAEDGHSIAHWLSPRNTGTSGWRVGGLGSGGFDWTRIKSGRKYTLMFRHRSSGWGAAQTFLVTLQSGGGTNALYTGDNVALNVGWTEYRRVFTAAVDGYSGVQIYFNLPGIPQTTTDGVIDVRDWMLVEGDYQGGFFDGSKTFSKWEGTANGSTSLGYPPQLRDVAGAPYYDGMNVAQGTTLSMPNGPLTIYSVQKLGASTGNPGYWELANGGAWSVSTGVARLIGNTSTLGRFDALKTPSGSINTNVTANPLVFNVFASSFECSVSGADVQANNGQNFYTATDVTYRASSSPTLYVGTRDGSNISTCTTSRLMVYQGRHNIETRLAITRYLGSQYGVVVS